MAFRDLYPCIDKKYGLQDMLCSQLMKVYLRVTTAKLDAWFFAYSGHSVCRVFCKMSRCGLCARCLEILGAGLLRALECRGDVADPSLEPQSVTRLDIFG